MPYNQEDLRRDAEAWAALPETRRRFPNMKPEDVMSNYLTHMQEQGAPDRVQTGIARGRISGIVTHGMAPESISPQMSPTLNALMMMKRGGSDRTTQMPRTPEEMEQQVNERRARGGTVAARIRNRQARR